MRMAGPAILGWLIAAATGATPPADKPEMASFRMMDTDQNNQVSLQEWKLSVDYATAQLPQGPAAEDYRCGLMQLFQNLDADRSGSLSEREWSEGKFEIGPDYCPTPGQGQS